MSDVSMAWRPVSAWEGLLTGPGRQGRADGAAGVTVTMIDHVDMATLIAVGSDTTRMAAVVGELWGLELPAAGRTSTNAAATLVWSGPGQWLAIPKAYDFAALVAACEGVAAASEQGDGRALVEIAGRSARDVLAKGIAIDLHPSVFTPGCTAVTALSHLSVQLWQTDDAPTYVLSAPRTVAGHVWEWLVDSAAEFGCEIRLRRSL